MKQRAGLPLLAVLLLLIAGIQYGWVALFSEEGHPAVSVGDSHGIWLELGEGFPQPGVHQFIDETTLCSVIQMTLGEEASVRCLKNASDRPLASGDFLSLQMEGGEIIEINQGWMTAKRRMVLAIPLQPQTMTPDDWLALPGIGPKLAAAIELDRQKNGGFRSLADLKRVPGIGSGRLSAWRKYFLK
ncbi:MAG: helix-hairpin-helix domain-containing protein [Desulfuromonadaceae bacterium]|nr:helix-hairpin-helix domain-containing protein [Desulfuromonadaceae bacterium]